MDGFQSVVSISLPSFQERARTRFVSNLSKLFRNTHTHNQELVILGEGDYSYL